MSASTESRPNPVSTTGSELELPKAMVVFSGARDRYQVPIALKEAGLLQRLVVENYLSPESGLAALARKVSPNLGGSRSCRGLGAADVQLAHGAFVSFLASRYTGNYKLMHLHDRLLGRAARQGAAKSQAAVLAYSYYAASAFRPGPDRPSLRFLFQVHPHPRFMKRVLREELEAVPEAHASLRKEAELALHGSSFDGLASETSLANGWMTASSFTARTLAEAGVPRDRIHVISYGVDAQIFRERSHPPSDKRLKVLFVGSVIQRKGIAYLLQAVSRLNSRTVRLVLAGRGPVDQQLLRAFPQMRYELARDLSTEQLVQTLHSSDVLVLPSLAEGFGHVILEAMSCGVPVITTPCTGGPDLIVDGVHGFLVPPRDVDRLADRVEWCVGHRQELAEIGRLAAEQARLFTWEQFRSGIRQAYAEMVRDAHAQGVS